MPDLKIPSYDEMMNPTLEAIRQLGGSATIEEITQLASELMKLSDEQMDVIHNSERSTLHVDPDWFQSI